MCIDFKLQRKILLLYFNQSINFFLFHLHIFPRDLQENVKQNRANVKELSRTGSGDAKILVLSR